ncbi:uncharacterized protein LOC133186368 [Saccostrea echinata]|uniref:uncharacterized protein LOC133186368 n=1 Tax=Saccostrea echinata TaxID=191078 RepID=UPI002A7EBF67|nr:uncharacterized protein LOC133186368 [Saccostrea echinata]
MGVWIYITTCLLFAEVCICLENPNLLQQLIEKLDKLDDVRNNRHKEETVIHEDEPPKSSLQKLGQKLGDGYENALRILQKLIVHEKRDHVIPEVDLSHFTCTQEYYGLRKLVDNLAKKYCVVKDGHVHDALDGF